MHLPKLALAFLTFFCITTAFPQGVEKELMLVLPDTSAEQLQNVDVTLGPGNEICYHFHSDSTRLITGTKTHEPLGSEKRTPPDAYLFYNEENKGQYIKSRYKAAVFGPYDDTIGFANSYGYLAHTMTSADSVRYYINGVRVGTTSRSDYITRAHAAYIYRWCVFSRNGNALYTIKKGKWNYLFVNGRLVDSSLNYYSRLYIDNNVNYQYMLGNFEAQGRSYDFKPITHEPQRTLHSFNIPLGTVWLTGAYDQTLLYQDDDTLYYYGNGNGIDYLKVSPFDKPTNGQTVVVTTKGNTIFSYRLSPRQAGTRFDASGTAPTRVCVNGVGRDLPYDEITLPCIDSEGHYALFGVRDYYLYKNINGEEAKQPLSKHGVRAKPISIDVKGNTIAYYETDDSVYVYENNRLFKRCALSQFELKLGTRSIGYNEAGEETLPILCMADTSYIVYNNTISPPLLRINEDYSPSEFLIGAVRSGKVNGHGYWLLQKTGKRTYELIANHRRITLPQGINFESSINPHLASSFELNAHDFILYSAEGKNIYRYKIRL